MLSTFLLGLVALGAVMFVLAPYLTGSIKAEKRRAALQAQTKRGTERVVDGGARRKQVAESLKELEKKGKRKRVTLENRLGRAGLLITPKTFYLISAATGLGLGVVVFLTSENPLFGAAAAGIGGFGLPNWVLRFRGKRRINRFIHEFPAAIDIIVRGIRAGLPLGDCLRVIANEAAEPVKTEFRHIVESQSIGLSLSESVERIVERVPIPEANFFAIVISIQQKAGGNLSEALSNLSRVLRERKKMRSKVKAVASEANASAMIIGCMPFVVGTLIYLTSPHYIELLWTTSTGRMMMAVGAVWMSIGVAVMKKMIAFEI
jgi:tight adherence protein B